MNLSSDFSNHHHLLYCHFLCHHYVFWESFFSDGCLIFNYSFIGDPPFYFKSPHLPSASFPSSVALKLQLRVKCRRREFKVARPARRPLKHPPRPGVDGPPTRICTKRDIHTLFLFLPLIRKGFFNLCLVLIVKDHLAIHLLIGSEVS